MGLSDVSSDAESDGNLGPESSKAPHLCDAVDDYGMLHDDVLTFNEDGTSDVEDELSSDCSNVRHISLTFCM